MKYLKIGFAFSLIILASGCTTTSRVQEMIDASQQDFLRSSDANATSIAILQKTAKLSLEQAKEQSQKMEVLQQQFVKNEKALGRTVKALNALAESVEASQVLSASNILKMSELTEAVAGNKSVIDVQVEKMLLIDELYEEVMIGYYRQVARNALLAVASLEADNKPNDTKKVARVPVSLTDPIEIKAPNTTDAAPDAASKK